MWKVPLGKTSSARGPECFPRPTAESSIQYQGQSFCHTHRCGPLNNFFFSAGLFFSALLRMARKTSGPCDSMQPTGKLFLLANQRACFCKAMLQSILSSCYFHSSFKLKVVLLETENGLNCREKVP